MKTSAFFLVLGTSLTLAGCSSLLGGGGREPTSIYSPQVQVTADPNWPSVPASIVVAKPSAARVLDSSRIAVRPTPDELQVYHGAAWAQSATDMLQDAVTRTLEDSGKTGGTGTTDAGIRGVYKLVMDVRRFEADYAGGATPSAVLVVNAKLVQNADQSVAASRTFNVIQPASGTETGVVVQAFDQALTQLTTQIVGWTLTSVQAHPAVEYGAPKPAAAAQ
ncbi:cholesterol transport system auxiliary component [Pseudoxanthomonas sp. GM95]|uniref:ABC-type transport auxiliary lipoprotein family protein n=1 Tax=Pseudoxanthomonas sp. GM95 TaxID=1881043 RepID=UPI0008B724E8|nr:ABC-type transport auxiliary lipoprotein family protein [Pseudoxanthomonas sp. GM95]SEK43592.1 cholesterol transport system auxiliary component [Pseudoxanthomonas sp. GM95]